MERTAKPFSVLLALAVAGSLFFVYRHLGTTRHAPLLSVPDGRGDVSDQSQQTEGHRIPTIVAPDSGEEDMPSGLPPPRLPALGSDATPGSVEPSIPSPPGLPGGVDRSPEGLVPIPNPFERTLSGESDSEVREGEHQ
jgi:hypothetical protein